MAYDIDAQLLQLQRNYAIETGIGVHRRRIERTRRAPERETAATHLRKVIAGIKFKNPQMSESEAWTFTFKTFPDLYLAYRAEANLGIGSPVFIEPSEDAPDDAEDTALAARQAFEALVARVKGRGTREPNADGTGKDRWRVLTDAEAFDAAKREDPAGFRKYRE
jgi:hypothetical protein